MPVVPVQVTQSVGLKPISAGGVNVRSSPDDFGAGIGAGLGRVADGLTGAANAFAVVQQKEDEARVKAADDSFSEAVRREAYDPENGFMSKGGKTAVDAWPGYQKRVEELRLEHGKGLSGDAANMYDQVSKTRQQQAVGAGMQHTGQQRKTWFQQSSEARLTTFQNDAVAAYADPKAVEQNIANGLLELQSRGKDDGWGAEVLSQKSAEYASSVRRNVVARLAEEDPLKADAYYQQHKSRFVGADQYAIEKVLVEGVAVERGKQHAIRIQSETAAAPVGAALDLVRGFEGFRDTPYWDVNALRAGYGSDTVTRADGTVEKVGKNTRVSRADAERDIERRLKQFQNGIVKDIGEKAWGALPEGAKAALSSVAYNYGSLPENVKKAAMSGDTASIANAIRSRGDDNGGINKGRRNKEAAAVEGGYSSGPAPSFVDVETKLAAIENPREREQARLFLNANIEAQSKAHKAAEKEAELQLYSVIEQGGTPDDLPIETRLTAGMSSVSAAWAYHEARLKRGQPETDQELLYNMRRLGASDPAAFSGVNLLEYRDKLDDAAFKELTDTQTSWVSSSRKAVQTGSIYADAYKQADSQLEAVGLSLTGLGGKNDAVAREAMAKRIALFQNGLKERVDDFQASNNRAPEYAETQKIISQMLLPMIVKGSANIFGSETEGLLFEAPNRGDGQDIEVNVKYENIPHELRVSISRTFELRENRPPTPEEIEQEYEDLMLERPSPRPNVPAFDPAAEVGLPDGWQSERERPLDPNSSGW